MKALSLLQPWAQLVAIGAKEYETRSWATDYRGPLAIHASKGFSKENRELCLEWPFDEALLKAGIGCPGALPRGLVIATCVLVGCYRINKPNPRISPEEQSFGNWKVGRFAWRLQDVKLIAPVEAKGRLGLWEWEQEAS